MKSAPTNAFTRFISAVGHQAHALGRNEEGNIFLFLGIGMLLLVGVLALSVDMGKTELNQNNYSEIVRNSTTLPVQELAYMLVRCKSGATDRPNNLLTTCMDGPRLPEALGIIDTYIVDYISSTAGQDQPEFVTSRPEIRKNSQGVWYLYVSLGFPKSDMFVVSEQGSNRTGNRGVTVNRAARTLTNADGQIIVDCSGRECISRADTGVVVESGKLILAPQPCTDPDNCPLDTRMMWVFDVSTPAKWGDTSTQVTKEIAQERLIGFGDAPTKVEEILEELGFETTSSMECGANVFGTMNVCNVKDKDGNLVPGDCGCNVTMDSKFGWDGCVYAPDTKAKDEVAHDCKAVQHRVYELKAYTTAATKPFCNSPKADRVFDIWGHGQCKRGPGWVDVDCRYGTIQCGETCDLNAPPNCTPYERCE